MAIDRPATTSDVIAILEAQQEVSQWTETVVACQAIIAAIQQNQEYDPAFILDNFHAVGIAALIAGFDEGRNAAAMALPHIVRLATTRDSGSNPLYKE